jgi:predicted RND superfamily exporter protein
MAMLGYNLDPLILVLPFLIAMMTARHGMQKLVRYTEEYMKVGDGRRAARNVIVAMFAAGVTGIVTDSFGVALVALAVIPILQDISMVCVLWTIPTLIIALILTPLLLSFVPVSKALMAQYQKRQKGELTPGLLDRVLGRIGNWIVGKGKWVVVVVTVVVVGVSYVYARRIEVGDFVPGSSILWPDHRYNKDALRITYSMPLLNPIYIIMVGGDDMWDLAYTKAEPDSRALREMEKFQRYLAKHPRIIFVNSLINYVPSLSSGVRDGNPNYYYMKHEDNESTYFMRSLIQRGRPGDWSQFANNKTSAANIIVYCRDKMPRTLKSIFEYINKYVEEVKLTKGKLLLAGGALGVQAAVRDEIESAQILNLSLALLGLFVFCTINFRSIAAGLILVIPLAISNVITFALMGAYQIGLTVNTYPISSIGIGLGVDYGIYLVSRVLEEKKTAADLNTAIVRSVINNGRAIVIIATTLTIGLICWLFSELKFQAEMGALLAIVLFFNMLGALLLVPSFIAIFKPKFVLKK